MRSNLSRPKSQFGIAAMRAMQTVSIFVALCGLTACPLLAWVTGWGLLANLDSGFLTLFLIAVVFGLLLYFTGWLTLYVPWLVCFRFGPRAIKAFQKMFTIIEFVIVRWVWDTNKHVVSVGFIATVVIAVTLFLAVWKVGRLLSGELREEQPVAV